MQILVPWVRLRDRMPRVVVWCRLPYSNPRPIERFGAACRGTSHETVLAASLHSPMLVGGGPEDSEDAEVAGRGVFED